MIRPTDNFYMRHATAIAIAAVSFLVIVAALVFDQQNAAGAAARGWVNHTYEVKGHIQALLSKLEDAEVGERGYMLTGKTEFLAPYKEALQDSSAARPRSDDLGQHHSIAEELEILRRLTSDNPNQQQNLDDTGSGVTEFLTYLASMIEARDAGKTADVQGDANLRRGKELMDNLRGDVKIMTAEENHLLSLRVQADDANARQNATMIFAGIGVFYVLMVLSIWIYQRTRQRSQAELLTYMQQLERSEEELKMQQEELKASNEEIEASNEELEEQNAQIRQQSEELVRSKQLIEEKAREVELASKYKSEFLANMSHELRTPLNSLLILARSLASNEDGNLSESQIEEANIIHNDGLELLNLINDILDLSKVEAGKLNVIAEDAALDGIVRRLQQQFAPIAKEKSVAFPIELDAGLPATLHTDTQRVEQILKNLLSNAFKFTEKGSVTLRIHRPDQANMQRSTLDPSGAVAFSVTDTGIGIETSRFKDIFEAFQQEDGSIDRHYGGTGLGLTIARKFAHLLGGEIHVASKKGEGSTFTLVLPARFEGQAPEEAKAPSPDMTTRTALKVMPRASLAEFVADDRKNIGDRDKVLLIIEDDKNFAIALMKIARKRGYKCLAAGDGKTGLLLAVEEPVMAIILDLKLPDIDGMQILDQLKHDLRTRHIPVHIITGRAEDGNVVSLRKGAIGYLTKPVAQESIDGAFAKIETLLQAGMKQVLVIEDDKKNQVAIQNLLKKKDISLIVAGTGMAALGHLRTMAFDCVILDLRLPDMTGFEWLEKAEQESGDKDLPPIIVYTAKELSEDENRQLNRYTGSIIIKGAQSPERLLDEVTLFLHSVESTLSKDQQDIIRMQHDPDQVLQERTVLLVDDDLRNTFALSKLLKKHGMNVVIADNGRMALDKLKEVAAIDLVIMDIMMPVMDGYQAMKEIRAQAVHQNLPIIALTARAMPEEQEKCMEAGANDYLTKPVDIERLLTLLRVWLFTHEMAA
ncbi:MAG: response regulator [Alphaproteobacteria bacterium]|nr:response regulator [Alphaproteobacteria bacterium]